MSYDLCFWREPVATDVGSQEIYERLCDETEADGVEWMDISAAKAAFAEAFPEIEDFGTELNMDGECWFQVTWPVSRHPGATQGLLLTCAWGLVDDSATQARIGAVAKALGCVVYDPQLGQKTC